MASAMCGALATCGMCLWDATVDDAAGIPEDLECMWCPSTGTCINADSECAVEGLFANSSRTECPELQCHLAYVSMNVYVCDWEVLAFSWVNVLMLVFCAIYWMWLAAVRQKPWKHPAVLRSAQRRWEGNEEGLIEEEASTREEVIELEDGDEDAGMSVSVRSAVLTPITGRPTTSSVHDDECPLCTANGGECPWCFLLRFAFLPLLLGFTTVVANLLSSLLFSLRKGFYTPYLTCTTLFAAISFVLFYVFFILPIRAASSWDPCYVRLAWMLRWRKLDTLNPNVAAAAPEGEEEPESTGVKGAIESLPQAPSFFSQPTEYLKQHIAAAVGSVSPAKGSPLTRPGDTPPSRPSGTPTVRRNAPHPLKFDGGAGGADAPPEASSSNSPLTSQSATFTLRAPPALTPSALAMAGEVVPAAALVTADQRNDIVEEEMKEMMLMVKEGIPLCVSGEDDAVVEQVAGLPADLKPQLAALMNREEDVVDERVLWCYQPKVLHLIQHEMLFLILNFVMVLAAVFLLQVANDKTLPPARVIGKANLFFAAVVILCTSGFLVTIFLLSCKRVYVLTTHNVMTLCNVAYRWSVTSQPTMEMDCGLVSVYTEFGQRHAGYSWRRPRSMTRRMEALPTSQFICIQNVDGLIDKIHKFCPPITARVWKGRTDELNQEWRVHMGLTFFLFLLSVMSTHYDTIPTNVVALGVAIVLTLTIAVFQKGMRHHLTNNQPVDTLSKDSKWIRSTWVAKEVRMRKASQSPNYDDILDSQTALHPRA